MEILGRGVASVGERVGERVGAIVVAGVLTAMTVESELENDLVVSVDLLLRAWLPWMASTSLVFSW